MLSSLYVTKLTQNERTQSDIKDLKMMLDILLYQQTNPMILFLYIGKLQVTISLVSDIYSHSRITIEEIYFEQNIFLKFMFTF